MSSHNRRFDINSFLDRLMQAILNDNLAEAIPAEEVHTMLIQVRRVFQRQPVFLKISAPVIVCGDLHGQLNDVLRMFDSLGYPNRRTYLFLGDYVDRGRQSPELILFMFACKLRYERNFFMLRGNHETSSINRVYGFWDQLLTAYRNEALFNAFQQVFNYMPLSCLISNRILCMHGGLSPSLLQANSLDILNGIRRPLRDNQINMNDNELAVDLLWADPDVNVQGLQFQANRRGIGHSFGQEVINRVRRRFGLDLIIRAHQVVLDGHEFFNNDMDSGLITLFTAPHYCGMYNNSGAVVQIARDLEINLRVFKPIFPTEQAQQDATANGNGTARTNETRRT